MKNIVLIGISGSGKTSIGEMLAINLLKKFIDLDSLIVEREGKTIEEIFNKAGEKGFRQAETEAIESLEGKGNSIIACGGGVILKEYNMDILSKNALVIFMNRPVKDILLQANLKDRPLLKKNPRALYSLYEERLHLYKKHADFEVDCHRPVDDILKELAKIASLETVKKKLAVIGDPINHSLSPDIHKAALGPFLKALDYEKIKIEKGQLKSWIEKIKEEKIDAFSVTMPHKEDITSLLDKIDEDAGMLGSVNTVVNKGGGLWGYSTDGEGFAKALEAKAEEVWNRPITIIGTGGASATIAMKAAQRGVKNINLIGRNIEKKIEIKNKVEKFFDISWGLYDFPPENAGKEAFSAGALVNSTPLGMGGMGEDFRDFSFLDQLPKDAVVFDIIYNPLKTKLLAEAEARGLQTLNGISMLIEQALEADNIFLGVNLGRQKAYDRAVESLKGKVY